MLRRALRRLVHRVRRFNRAWIDALDPDHDPDARWAEAPPRPDAAPAGPVAEVAPPTRPEPAPSVPRSAEVWAEPTPNPDAMKFSASVPIAPRGALTFDDAAAAATHPVGRAVFAVGGVKSMFAVNDFVTVTRVPDADWAVMAPKIEAAIAGALAS